MKRLPVIAIFVLFIALCVSAAYWAMQLFKPPLRPVAAPPQISKAEVKLDAAAALFGGRAAATAVASNYQLKGVILAGEPNESVAILATDGRPGQAIVVDSEVAPGVTVKEVHARYVLLSEGGTIKRVELPESAKDQVSVDMVGNAPASAPVPPAQAGQPVQPGLQMPPAMPQMPQAQPGQAVPSSPSIPPAQPNQAAPPVSAAPGLQAPPVMQASPPAGAARSFTPVPRGGSQ